MSIKLTRRKRISLTFFFRAYENSAAQDYTELKFKKYENI